MINLKYLIKEVQREIQVKPDGIAGLITWGAIYRRICKSRGEGFPNYAKEAESHVGLKEVPGKLSNPTILGWIKGFFPWAKDDGQLAWCAIFINTMLENNGIEGTGKANARSFLNWGRETTTPNKGDIVVFERGGKNSWKGHVGLYWGDADDKHVYCLGGNQRNQVSIGKYPKSKILGYRKVS